MILDSAFTQRWMSSSTFYVWRNMMKSLLYNDIVTDIRQRTWVFTGHTTDCVWVHVLHCSQTRLCRWRKCPSGKSRSNNLWGSRIACMVTSCRIQMWHLRVWESWGKYRDSIVSWWNVTALTTILISTTIKNLCACFSNRPEARAQTERLCSGCPLFLPNGRTFWTHTRR